MVSRSGTDFPLLPGAATASTPMSHGPMSYGQQRLWFLHELRGGSLEYHVPEAFRLRGELDRAALHAAIETVVARHDSLRTRFPATGGEPTPVVDPPGPIELTVTELRDLAEPAREAKVEDAVRREWSLPFDLANGPVWRARLLRLADTDHLLLLTIHHIASDGWSQGLLFAELRALYNAYRAGEPNPLPPLPIQYADFAAWQRDRIDAGALTDDLAYWREQLAGLPELLAFPADRPRKVTDITPGSVCRLALDNAMLTRLRGLARTHGVTLYMLLLAAFMVLLSRCSATRDIAVGSPIANRDRVELERLIGLFVNTVVLRQDVRPDLRFGDLLDGVRRTALDAYTHQDVPFDLIVEHLSPDRRLDRTPLIQVMFALNVSSAAPLRLGGLDVTPVESVGIRARFDLELHAVESPVELTLRWVYDENLFDRWRIEQLARHYLRVLDQVCADPDLLVGDIDLLDADERAWLTSRHGATSSEPATEIGALFADQVRRRPDAVALRHNEISYTYAELDRRAERIAARLAAHGVPTGGTVGLSLPPGPDFVAASLGVLRYGATLLPLDPTDPVKRTTFVVQDGAADAVLTDPAKPDRFAAVGLTVIPVAPELGGESDAVVGDPAPLVVLSYVSGAADCADGVEISRDALNHAVRVLHQELGLGPDDRVPLGTSIPLLFAALTAGAELVDPGSGDRHTVEPVTDYGATETTGPCLVHRGHTDGDDQYPPVGRPVADTTALVLDERLRPVPVGVIGELYLGGPGLACGYRNRPELTARRFVDDPSRPGARLWRSGDLARWRPDGELVLAGRVDDQIRVNGVRITPVEVDTALRRHMEVREAATIVTEDGSGAARLASYVVLRKASLVNADDLRVHLATWLPAGVVPVEVWLVEEIPRTLDGAADRTALRATSTPDTDIGTDSRTATEDLLQPMFASVLGLPEVGVNDSFFVLGGHSMMAMRLIAMVYETTGIELAVRDVFEAPTVTALAATIETRRG